MGYKTTSTRRSTATSTVSSQAVIVNSGNTASAGSSPAFTAVGSTIASNTSISLGVTAVGQTSAATTTVVSAGPTIANVQYLDANNVVISGDVAVSTSGGNILITGSGFVANSNVYINNALVTNTFISSTQIRAICPSASSGNVTLMIFTPTNVGTIGINAVRYSGIPTWTTAAVGLINNVTSNVALVVSSDSTLTYTLQAGSVLPTGMSLNSAGYVSGTPTGYSNNTSSTAVIIATDQEGQATQQTINFTVQVGDAQFKFTTLLMNGETTNIPFINDASTNDFPLTIAGDTKANKFSPYYGDGYYSNYFNGSTDYLGTPTTLSTAIVGLAGTTWTIEAWVFVGALNSANTYNTALFGTYAAVAANGRWYLGYTSAAGANAKLRFTYTTGTGSQVDLDTTATFNLNSWVHVAVTIDATTSASSTITSYINGVGQTFTAQNMSTQTANYGAPYIGGNLSTFVNNHNGYISNLRMVKGSLVYNGNFTPSTTPLSTVGNTLLLTCQSNRFIDKSTNAYAITLTGTPQVSPSIPFAASNSYATYGSAYFDGTGDYLTMTASSAFSTTGDVTFECWVFPQSFAVTSYILDIYSSTTTGIGSLQLAILTTGAIRWYYDATTALSSTSTLSLNTWAHLAFVRSSGTLKIYINGVAESTTASFSGLIGRADLVPYVGSNRTPANYFTGFISNFRITKSAVYTTNFTNPSAPLTAVANTQLLSLQYNGPANNIGFIDNGPFNVPVTRAGNATQGTFSPYSATGWSTFLNGASYLQYPNLTAYSPRTGSFTLECWVYNTTAAGSNNWYVSHISGGVSLYRDTTGKLAFAKDAIAVIATSTNTIPVNAWVHLAVARSGTTLKLFINGSQEASVTDSTDMTSTGNFDIGITSGATGPMTGYISNVRLVTGSALYTGAFTPSTSPLTAISGTQFLGCQSNRFVDNSTNNATATVGSAPVIQAFSPFPPAAAYTPSIHGGSMYLDGAGDYLSFPGVTIGTNPYTVECWFYISNFSVAYALLSTSNANALDLRINNATTFAIDQQNVAQTTFTVPTMSPNTWYHVAFVRNASNQATVFLNGVQSSTGFVSMTTNYNALSNYVGLIGTNYFPGFISDLRVVNGTALYSANFTPPTTPLTSPTATPANLLLNFTNGGIVDAHASLNYENGTGVQVNTAITKYGTGSLSFNGSSYLAPYTTGGNVSNEMFYMRGDFTVEAWVYTNSLASTQLILTFGSETSSRWQAQISTTGQLAYDLYGVGTTTFTTGGATVPVTTWTHVAWVRYNGVISAYINGVVQGTVSQSSVLGNGPMSIGVNASRNSGYFNGYMDDLRITKGFARYTANFTPPTVGLLGQ